MSDVITPFQEFQVFPPAQLPLSSLSNQLEALGDQIDLSSINLQIAGKTAMQIRQAITSARITRTIEGASTLKIVIEDSDLSIIRSGYVGGSALTVTPSVGTATKSGIAFNQPVDCEIDGLYFRLVQIDKSPLSYSVTLTFEDREIAVLRSYPRAGDPQTYKIFAGKNRIAVMIDLIEEPEEYAAVGGIRWWSPLAAQAVPPITTAFDPALKAAFPSVYTGPPAPTQTQVAAQNAANAARSPGFPPAPTTVTGGGFTVSTPSTGTPITVKGVPATAAQLAVLDAVIRAGHFAGEAKWVIIAAVATVTVESDASNPPGPTPGNPSVGAFQQQPQYYPGVDLTNVSDAAAAFYKKAGDALATTFTDFGNPAALAATVQDPQAITLFTSRYGQWVPEATSTVDSWKGNDDPNLPAASGTGATWAASGTPNATSPPAVVGAAVFSRGSMTNQGGKMVVVTENNWQCLVRLAQEVGWLVFCVSGTIYITDYSIYQSAIRMRVRDGDPGIDGIGFSIDTAKESAKATVDCRISRWGAPPGSVAAVDDMGPASGRWLVQTIERDLFSFSGEVTLSKPQTTLKDAESASPVQGIQILGPSGVAANPADAGAPLLRPANTPPQPPLVLPAGFVFYDQGDPRWARDGIYSVGNTIGADGCGPTSAAMVIATLTRQNITPYDTGTYMTQTGGFSSAGATVSGLISVCQHYGLTATPIGLSTSAAFACLRAGGYVICGGLGPPPFTTAGHVVVLRAASQTNFVVANPDSQIPNPANGFPAPLAGALYMIAVTLT